MTIPAYINHGRLIAECPVCRSAEFVAPGQLEFECGNERIAKEYAERGEIFPGRVLIGCGHRDRLQFPADFDSIWVALRQRPLVNQNWVPGETLVDLRLENAGHQLPSGLEAN